MPEAREEQAALHLGDKSLTVADAFSEENDVTLFRGDCLEMLRQLPDESVSLVVTSPPYNVGKEYEQKLGLDAYRSQQAEVIGECVRALRPDGSICWQVGNYVDRGAIVPLDCLLFPVFADLGLQMRNRIVWHFEHGLHCKRRFSGRHETIMWFTRTDDYYFDLDPVRVPQKYPGKRHFKGPKAGQYSCNPKGKNPGDVWLIPNVKANHVEKTDHPCQFPVGLVERLVLSMTGPRSLVVDPFLGVGSTAIAAVRHDRRAAGAEIRDDYVELARERIRKEEAGVLRTRPMGKRVHTPSGREKVTLNPWSG